MAVFQPWGSFPCGSCSHSVLLWSSAGDWTGCDHPDGFLVHLLLIPLAVQAAQEVCWLHAPQLTGSRLCGDHLSLQGSHLQASTSCQHTFACTYGEDDFSAWVHFSPVSKHSRMGGTCVGPGARRAPSLLHKCLWQTCSLGLEVLL